MGHHGEQIAEFVKAESGKRSDRPQLAAAMALAKRRKAALLVAKLDRLSRSVAFIATLMDSRGFDLAIADMPGANRLTLHVLAAATEQDMRSASAHAKRLPPPRHAASSSAIRSRPRSIELRRPSRLKPCAHTLAARRAVRAANLNVRGIAAPNGGQWFPMQVRRVRDRLGL